MKRWEQENINDVAMAIYADGMQQFHSDKAWRSLDRLDNCQAWIIQLDDFILLKSYNTVVAVFEKNTGFLADVLRVVYGYTTTSAKHIAKFRHILPVVREYKARR